MEIKKDEKQTILTVCSHLLRGAREIPELHPLLFIKNTLAKLNAKPEDIGTTYQELLELYRLAYLAEMKEDIERYGQENNRRALLTLTRFFRQYFPALRAYGLSNEDVLDLLMEVRRVRNGLSDNKHTRLNLRTLN